MTTCIPPKSFIGIQTKNINKIIVHNRISKSRAKHRLGDSTFQFVVISSCYKYEQGFNPNGDKK